MTGSDSTPAKARSGPVVFGPFQLDVERRLLRGKSREIPLGSRAVDVLIALVSRPGELVSTRELIAYAWPRSIAPEANLRAQILALRRVLGDDEKGRRFIQNVPGRGYRFVCPVEHSPGAEPAPLEPDTAKAPTGIGVLGREDIVASILARMAHRRLLSIVGPGGIGKTSVARIVASAFGATRTDGVEWVDLSGLSHDQSPAEAIAVSIGLVNFASDYSPAVISWLKGRSLLLVIDCCDRVVSSVAALAERILAETTDVHILVTSRERLRAFAEHVVRLPPLSVPPEPDRLSAEGAMAYPAVRLFVERADSVLGGFTLRDEDVPYVARICASLDGIALAIELAAGHLVAIGLQKLAALLEDKFRLLPVGPRTALARHRTMHAVLEWSFDNLSPREREVLLGLAIFEGECGMAGIRAVITESRSSAEDLVEAVSRLVDKSLVVTRITAEGLTYFLLDTTRAFALERLEETGKSGELSRRHALFVLETLRRIETHGHALYATNWLDARRRQLANMRAALDWAYEADAEESLKLALSAVSARVFLDLSLVDQCRRRVDQALQVMAQGPNPDLVLEMHFRALLALASFYTPGPVQATVETLERVVSIAEHLNDLKYRAIALWGLWSVSIFRNEPAKALDFAEQFRTTHADLSDDARELLADRMSGTALHLLGDQPSARDRLEHVSTQFEPAVHSWNSLGFHLDHGLMARIYLARVFWLQGEPERALRTCQDTVEALRARGYAIAQCHALFEVAIPLNYMIGDLEAANADLALLQELAAKHGLTTFQAGAAWTAQAFSAIQQKTDLSACRTAARALQDCRYEVQYPWLSAIMAEEALRRGDTAAGIEWLVPCLAQSDGTSSGWWLAELQRLRGELVAAGAAPADREVAVAHLQQAVNTARSQGALILELRATVSRIGMDRGHRPPVDLKGELDSVLARFREGSAMADLIAARRLSAELSG